MHWPRVLAQFLLVVSVVLTGPPLATAQGAGDVTLEVVSATSYHVPTGDSRALYYVVAEVQNPADGPVGDVIARLVAYRADGGVAGQAQGYAYVSALGARERAPVALAVPEERGGEIVRHELSVVGRASTSMPFVPTLRHLGADRIWESALGQRFLIGELINSGPQTLAELTLIAGFYNADGRILHVARVPTLLQPVGPGQRTPFRIEPPSDPEVASWRLWYIATPFTGHPLPLNVRVAAAELDDYGRIIITAVVTNPSSVSARNLRAVAILRDAQGRIVNTSLWEPAAESDGVDGRSETTLRLVADAQPGFATIEVRAASSTALLVAPESHGIFFPIISTAISTTTAAPSGD